MSTVNSEPSKFVWYELHSPDAGPAQTFYRGVLGWSTQDAGMPDGSYTMISVENAPIGGILQKPASTFPSGVGAYWVGYIGVNDVDTYSKRIQNAGGTVHRPAEDIPNVGRFAVVSDPQGAMFVLFQPLNPTDQPPRPAAGTRGAPSWHELSAVDWESDFRFYADLFGWTKAQAIEMGPNAVYQLFATGAEPVGGMMTRMDPSQKPGWLFYFNVEDIEAGVNRVKNQGGQVLHGPATVPGGQQIAICLDTQGAGFGMVGPAKS
jgi:predicted enzyme related to lactoylglutathione lyase